MVESRSPPGLSKLVPTILNATMGYLIVLTNLIFSGLEQFDFGHDFQNQFLSWCLSGVKGEYLL